MVKDSKLYTQDHRLNGIDRLIKCGMRERRSPGSFPSGTISLMVGILYKGRECGKSRKSDEANN